MKWRSGRRSENVEDRRRMRPATAAKMGGLGIIVMLVITFLTKGNIGIGDILNLLANNGGQQAAAPVDRGPLTKQEQEMGDFLSVVLADTEDVWAKIFRTKLKAGYEKPTLVLFTGRVTSGCGQATAAIGPFYCPADRKLYIDPTFYNDLKNKLGAPGDFARAYVIAHEVGHHIQNLMGTSDKVHAAQKQMSKEEGNRLSVKLELQADFYAGVWAHHAQKMRNVIEKGDVEEALNAATAIGDDTLQKNAKGYVTPETFTHGTSEQRVYWFYKGLKTGDIRQGDTFNSDK